VDWIQLAQDMVQWRAIVYMAVNVTGYVKGRKILDTFIDYKLIRKHPLQCQLLPSLSRARNIGSSIYTCAKICKHDRIDLAVRYS
jgi:hypothetical protein